MNVHIIDAQFSVLLNLYWNAEEKFVSKPVNQIIESLHSTIDRLKKDNICIDFLYDLEQELKMYENQNYIGYMITLYQPVDSIPIRKFYLQSF